MSTIAHAAQVAKPILNVGVSYMTAFISSLVSFAIGGGIAWYVRGRGMAGVQIDLNNVKNEVEALKNKIAPSAPVTPAV